MAHSQCIKAQEGRFAASRAAEMSFFKSFASDFVPPIFDKFAFGVVGHKLLQNFPNGCHHGVAVRLGANHEDVKLQMLDEVANLVLSEATTFGRCEGLDCIIVKG